MSEEGGGGGVGDLGMLTTTLNVERKHEMTLFVIIKGNLKILKLDTCFQTCLLINLRSKINLFFP